MLNPIKNRPTYCTAAISRRNNSSTRITSRALVKAEDAGEAAVRMFISESIVGSGARCCILAVNGSWMPFGRGQIPHEGGIYLLSVKVSGSNTWVPVYTGMSKRLKGRLTKGHERIRELIDIGISNELRVTFWLTPGYKDDEEKVLACIDFPRNSKLNGGYRDIELPFDQRISISKFGATILCPEIY